MNKVVSTVAFVCVLCVSLFSVAVPVGTGIHFDGSTAFKLESDGIELNARKFTVSLRVKVCDPAKNQMFLSMGPPDKDFSLYLYKNRVRMLVQTGKDSYRYASVPVPAADVWTHYAGTYDGEFIRIYRDGILQDEKKAPFKKCFFSRKFVLGAYCGGYERILEGAADDICLWNRVLSEEELKAVFKDEPDEDEMLAHWSLDGCTDEGIMSVGENNFLLRKYHPFNVNLINEKYSGFRGIWYYNEKSGDEYVYKYSGGLGTYCAKHRPMAWYAEEVDKTFFCYGGTDENNSTLLHMVSFYDHESGTVARPTLLLDKKTTDAHDNPVINLDDKGYIWIFSSSHGTERPSFICRSVKPYDIDKFQLMWQGNYSYPQPMYYSGRGFMLMHTWYQPGRGMFLMTSNPDGTEWSSRKKISYIERGHYQVSNIWQGRKTGTAFNMHPKKKGLNWRTNLYYMESDDFGKTWRTAGGRMLDIPLSKADCPALVAEYESKGRNVYMKDIQFDSQGNPLILVVTSKGYQAGPENGPREWIVHHWNGKNWEALETGIQSGNNYDTGSIYVESDTVWRIIGPTRLGPQPYNPGGEISMWLTRDAGRKWEEVHRMTNNSERNHTYVREPVNAHPDFYGFWSDGHGRKPSKSLLYFCNKSGDVFCLPIMMSGDFVRPEPVE
ncbi:MAG: BNR-4 repeat-containing protein [Kiritimatiellia bacterium]